MSEYDEETLRLARSYSGDHTVARQFSEEVFCEYASERWALGDFLEAVSAAIDKIPPELRESAVVDLEGEYDESSKLIISYTRTETAEEMAERFERGLAYARRAQAEERARYEALRQKFGE